MSERQLMNIIFLLKGFSKDLNNHSPSAVNASNYEWFKNVLTSAEDFYLQNKIIDTNILFCLSTTGLLDKNIWPLWQTYFWFAFRAVEYRSVKFWSVKFCLVEFRAVKFWSVKFWSIEFRAVKFWSVKFLINWILISWILINWFLSSWSLSSISWPYSPFLVYFRFEKPIFFLL